MVHLVDEVKYGYEYDELIRRNVRNVFRILESYNDVVFHQCVCECDEFDVQDDKMILGTLDICKVVG